LKTRSEDSSTTVNFEENKKTAFIASKKIIIIRTADFYIQSFNQLNESLFRNEMIKLKKMMRKVLKSE